MTPRSPAFGVAGDRDPDDGRADLGRDGDGRRGLVDRDRLDRADVRAPSRPRRRARSGRGRPWRRARRRCRRRRGPPTAARPRRSEPGRRHASGVTAGLTGTGAGAGSYQRSGEVGAGVVVRPHPLGTRLGRRRVAARGGRGRGRPAGRVQRRRGVAGTERRGRRVSRRGDLVALGRLVGIDGVGVLGSSVMSVVVLAGGGR